MNVAVILTGHLRCWETVLPNFRETVIDRYQPDIFISTFRDQGFWVPVEGATGIHEGSPLLDLEAVQQAYRPVQMVVEDLDALLPAFEQRAKSFPNFFHRPKNIISMVRKILMGVQMVEQHVATTGKQYDLVIRMRPDMLLGQHLPDFDPAMFYTVWHRNHVGGGTGDQMQVGSLEAVSKFARISLNLEAIYQHTGLLCPHVMSEYWIKSLGLPWSEFQISKALQHTPNGEYRAV